MMRTSFVILAFAVSAASFASPFTNGSFESGPVPPYYAGGNGDPTVTGWLGTHTGYEWFTPSNADIGAADSGVACVDVANFVFNMGGIAQTFDTVPAQVYQVTFAASTSTYAGRTGTGILDVTAPGYTNSFNLTNFAQFANWQQFSFNFTATGISSTLEFANFEDGNQHFAFVDSVGVQAVPEPATWAILGVGAVGLLRRRRRN